ncbi:MAG: hypothetical protein KGL95_09635, partial [Patescibacteria group bacterium]|nr:hypothetical protein [Patescibacteria group bacterium]
VFYSYDQTHFWTQAQNNIIRLATGGNCEVKSLLEPLEELAIFSTLHTRYPELGKMQFSCHGKDKLFNNSSWCHRCYKCGRTYLFALATGIDPSSIGFEKDVLKEKNILEHYFAGAPEYERDLDYAFYILAKKLPSHPLTKVFKKRMAPKLRPEQWYKQHFNTLQIQDDLPEKYAKKLVSIYKKQLRMFKKSVV